MRHEDTPEINNPKIRFPVLEGDKLMKEVLNGGYNYNSLRDPKQEGYESSADQRQLNVELFQEQEDKDKRQ